VGPTADTGQYTGKTEKDHYDHEGDEAVGYLKSQIGSLSGD
jgi:hypothetical protein